MKRVLLFIATFALVASVSAQNVKGQKAALNSADKVYSLPGKPFMHKLVTFAGDEVAGVENLPKGLALMTDRPGYKYIYGKAPAAGEYKYTVTLNGGRKVDVGFTVSKDLAQPTPFMGVLTWNAFQSHISSDIIKAIADGFDTFGLKEAGYDHMCIDDEWAKHDRSADGRLQWGPKFQDYEGLVRYVHGKGLKIGTYSDAGSYTCSGAQPGSYGYEDVDAEDFVKWDFDLLKYDFCNAIGGDTPEDAEKAYTAMGTALDKAMTKAGKKPSDFKLYMCEWGGRQPWLWAANTGATCWRCTADTRDYWDDPAYRGGVKQVLDVMKKIWAYQGVNRWNDADMLIVGLHGTGYPSNAGGAGHKPGLNYEESLTNFGLWCMFASPLTLSNNITNLDGKPNDLTGKTVVNKDYATDLAIITNKEVIALDQDPLGQAGEPICDTKDYIVMQKDMADGHPALSVTNLSDLGRNIRVKLGDLTALKAGKTYKMRDLWNHCYLTTGKKVNKYTTNDEFVIWVPAHATYLYRFY